MSVLPGHFNYSGGSTTANIERDQPTSGSYYIDSWKRIIEVNPKIAIIADWNNWDEETAIEGCIDTEPRNYPGHGWRDLLGNPTFDWYLQITQAYANIFKYGTLLPYTYVQQDGLSPVLWWTGSRLIQYSSTYKPYQKPIIKLPFGWLQMHGYGADLPKALVDNEELELPTEYSVKQNYPNPFNPNTMIKYSVKDEGIVIIKVFNILGEEIITLVNETKLPGFYEVNFNASNLSNGIYIYSMQVANFNEAKKMILLK